MRIVFMSSTEFGFNCFKELLKMKKNIVAIYSLPQIFEASWSENHLKIATYKNFREVAVKNSIPFVEVKGRMKDYVDSVKSFKPDLILAIGWYYIIPKGILNIPPLGCIGIHASLLPKYRGGAPLVWAIINGEKETGISLFYFSEGIDNGDLIAQRKISISKKDNIKTVYEKAEKKSSEVLRKYLPKIEKGTASRKKQNENGGSYFSPRKPEDGLIDWDKDSDEIYNFIRAQTKPYPGTFFFNEKGNKIKVWASRLPLKNKKTNQKPGVILKWGEKEIKIATKDSYIVITDYEKEG